MKTAPMQFTKQKTFKLFTLCPFSLPKIDVPLSLPPPQKFKKKKKKKKKKLCRRCGSQNQGCEISGMEHRHDRAEEEGEVDAGRDDCHFNSISHGRWVIDWFSAQLKFLPLCFYRAITWEELKAIATNPATEPFVVSVNIPCMPWRKFSRHRSVNFATKF